MALEHVYTSAPLEYTLWDGVEPALFYHPELVEPPRLYTESVQFLRGLWTRRKRTLEAEAVYSLLTAEDQIYFPGWGITEWQWDAQSGAFLGRIDRGLSGEGPIEITTRVVTSSPYGHLYKQSQSLDAISEIDPESFEVIKLISEGGTLNWTYGAEESSTVGPFMIDPVADLAVLHTSLNSNTGVSIHRLSTRETLTYNIRTAGMIQDIQAETPGTCFVVHTNGVVTVLDYAQGQVLGVIRASASASLWDAKLAWDPVHRRVIVCEKTADAADGAATIHVEGYRPVPVPVALTPPIPLRAPRAGRTVPVLVRAYGDAGEGVGGVVVQAAETGDGTLLAASAASDEHGYATFNEFCDAEGSTQVEASATV